MISHRPFLSLIAVLLVVSGFIICMYTRLTRPTTNPAAKRRETIARVRARQRESERRKNMERKEERESDKETGSEVEETDNEDKKKK